ncbi:hypothetical protein TWF718_010825 [Orbilia javanica]|uniref:Uncharacterized protein n=1 Tax=Orbilia javanica TaxID=47235 RepID=A0AAN8R957_9PEZI
MIIQNAIKPAARSSAIPPITAPTMVPVLIPLDCEGDAGLTGEVFEMGSDVWDFKVDVLEVNVPEGEGEELEGEGEGLEDDGLDGGVVELEGRGFEMVEPVALLGAGEGELLTEVVVMDSSPIRTNRSE